jgi:hypothetical protein
VTKNDTPPKGLPALRTKRANHAELQPVSKRTKSGKRGYVR